MEAVASEWSWAAITIVILVGSPLQLLIGALALPFDRGRRVSGRFFRDMGVVAARLIPGWHFAIEGPLPSPRPRRTVVVSNHESQADPFLLSLLPWEMKYLSKQSLFRIPLLGWSMWMAGDIPVRRGEKSSAADAMARCARWLQRGVPVLIFPEGTRSRDRTLLPFKDGAFRLAIETGAEILPVAVHGTHDALPKTSWRFGRADARVTVGVPISTKGLGPADVEAIKAEARAQIEEMRRRLSALSAPPGRGGVSPASVIPSARG